MFYLTEISEITRLVFDIECWMQQTGISLSDVYKADWRSNNIYYEMSADLLSREREREREREGYYGLGRQHTGQCWVQSREMRETSLDIYLVIFLQLRSEI